MQLSCITSDVTTLTGRKKLHLLSFAGRGVKMEIPSTIKSILHKFDATIIEVNRMQDRELIRSGALWTNISKEKKMKFWSGKFNLAQTVEALLIAQGLDDEQVSNLW